MPKVPTIRNNQYIFTCPNCDNEVIENAPYCPWCGINFDEADHYCRSCGQRLERQGSHIVNNTRLYVLYKCKNDIKICPDAGKPVRLDDSGLRV